MPKHLDELVAKQLIFYSLFKRSLFGSQQKMATNPWTNEEAKLLYLLLEQQYKWCSFSWLSLSLMVNKNEEWNDDMIMNG